MIMQARNDVDPAADYIGIGVMHARYGTYVCADALYVIPGAWGIDTLILCPSRD